MTDHYMRLLTDVELDEKQQYIWTGLVQKFLGGGQAEHVVDNMTMDKEELEGDQDFPFVYVVYLSDKIDTDLAERLVYVWGEIYPRDFEIESSAEYDCDDCEVEIDEALHEEIQRRASKFFHNRWVEEQTQSGWRYSLSANQEQRTSPRLRDWDSLHESYRKPIVMTREQAVKFFQNYPHLFV